MKEEQRYAAIQDDITRLLDRAANEQAHAPHEARAAFIRVLEKQAIREFAWNRFFSEMVGLTWKAQER